MRKYIGENDMELCIAGPIDRMKLDLNGDTDYLDSNEMDDSRDFNKANELLAGDVDASGKVDATDTSQIQSWIDAGTYDVRGDVDLGGDVDSTDKTTVQNYTATKGGRTNLSHAEHANRKGYAGYEFDDTITHESYHVRHRVLNSVLGQWGRRDPLGYVDGTSLYSYTGSNPIAHSDPEGLDCPGCDGIPSIIENNCTLKCCSMHDFCYDQHDCTASPISPCGFFQDPNVYYLSSTGHFSAGRQRREVRDWPGGAPCGNCDLEVCRCFAECALYGPNHDPYDGQIVGCYCHKEQYFFRPSNGSCSGRDDECCCTAPNCN